MLSSRDWRSGSADDRDDRQRPRRARRFTTRARSPRRERSPISRRYRAWKDADVPRTACSSCAPRSTRSTRPARASSSTGDDPPLLIDIREFDEWDEGQIPGAIHIPRGNLESRIESAAPDKCAADRPLLRAGQPHRLRRQDARGARLHRRRLARRRLHRLEAQRLRHRAARRSLDDAKRARYSRHLLIPEVGEEGQLKLLDSRVLLIGAGGLGSPGGALSRGRRRRHARHRRRRQVDASNLQRQVAALDRAPRRVEGGVGEANARGAQSRRRGEDVRRAAHLGERRADPRRRLGRDRRRRRQLPDALPHQRRRRAGTTSRSCTARSTASRARSPSSKPHGGPVLPLPLPAAAAARARAVLRGGRRARRAAGHHRLAPGERGAEALPRHRRVARGPAAPLRRARRPSSARSSCAAIRTARSAASTRPSREYIDYVEFCSGRPTHA